MELEDRISDLPDDVLGHILSFLTFKEAVRSALLSRRWRMSNACYNLDFSDLFNVDKKKKNRRSLNVVDKIIRRSRGSNFLIEKFSVTFSWRDIGFSRSSIQLKLDRWINCLAKPGLAVLDLRVMDYRPDSEYFSCSYYIRDPDYFSFPLAMFASETTSLHVLSLDGFQLSSPVAAFSSLRSLSLKRVSFVDGVFEKILKVSPLLENLQLSECVGLKTFNIRGFLHLKKLQVDQCKGLRKIDIDAPTLEVLLLSPPNHMVTIASFLPCLRKFQFRSGCYFRFNTVVKFLGSQLPIDMLLYQFLSLCPLLKELMIGTCPTIQTFHFTTTLYALKTLHLMGLENMVKFEIIAPNLDNFFIEIYKNIPIISLDASDKLQVTVLFYFCDHPHDQMAEFLGAFNPCRAMKIYCNEVEGFFNIAKEMRNNLPSPLYGTKCLSFCLYNLDMRLSELVDYMLWLSPQATNLKIRSGFSDHSTTEIVLECVYEKIGIVSEGDLCPCCKLIPITCWRHCLKEVRIKEFLGDEVDKANVKSFFLEQVENLSIKETSFDSDSIQGGLYSSYNQLFKETANYDVDENPVK